MAAITTAAPDAPQNMTALAQANRVRLARSALKREIAAGERTVCQVLAEVPWEAETMTVFDLLRAQRRWERTRVVRFLRTIPMGEHKTIGSMTERQRRVLVRELGGIWPEPHRVPSQRDRVAASLQVDQARAAHHDVYPRRNGSRA